MQSVVAEDVTIPWGRAPDPLDQQTHRWRMAVFQDLQCSADGSKLYWLYDPVADETSGTSGGRKGGPSIVVFDMNMRCFLREIPLSVRPNVEGVPKFLFALNTPSPAGGAALVLCTQVQIPNAGGPVQFWRVNLSGDGVSLAGQLIPLLHSPIPVSEDWIVCLREDAPELALLTGPGLSVFRIDVQSQAPGQPLESFSVPDGNMRNYYDGFIHAGSFHMLSSTDDGTFDFSRVHKLDITGRNRMVMSGTRPDPERGYPPARKQAALDCTDGSILLAGGEFEDQSSRVHRLVDYWVLNLNTLEWLQLPGQMPLPLIEPRLTTVFSTHLRILRLTNFLQAGSSAPPYPGSGGDAGQPPPPPYPGTGGGSYPSQGGGNPPGYPPQGGRGGGGGGGYSPQQGGGYPPQGGGYPPQGGGYPPPGGYSADSKEQEAYSQQQQPGGYPTQQDQGGYPTQQQGDGYPTQQQGGGYPTQQQGGGYPTQQQGGGYPTQQQGQGGYPAQQQGQGGYPTQQQGGGYPAGQTAYYPPDSKPQKSQGCAVA